MSVPLFFAPAPQDSAAHDVAGNVTVQREGRPGPGASVRTTDKVRTVVAASSPGHGSSDQRPGPALSGAARTFFDALYDLIAPGIERLLDAHLH